MAVWLKSVHNCTEQAYLGLCSNPQPAYLNPTNGYYPLILKKGFSGPLNPFSRTQFQKNLGVSRINPTDMTVISMTHWDPMGMGMWHNCELNAYAHVYRYSNMYYHQFLELSTKIQFANLAKYAGRPSAPCPQADQMESITRFTLQVPYLGCVQDTCLPIGHPKSFAQVYGR